MAFKINNKSKEGNLITVSYTGHITLQELNESREELTQFLRTVDTRNILVDLTLAIDTLSLPDIFSYAVKTRDLPHDLNIALLVKNNELEKWKFGATAFFNRGWMIKIFQEKTEALNYLAEEY